MAAGSKFKFKDTDQGFAAERAATQMYNLRDYEGRFFHHNTCRRVSVYDHEVVVGEGIDHCYDCTCEATVLMDFVQRRHAQKTKAQRLELVQKMTFALSRALRPRFACVRACMRACASCTS